MSLMTMIIKMSEGLGKTCAIFFLTLLFSLPLGMIVALLRMSRVRIVSAITRAVITVLRGTPLMLQLLAVTYGPYYLFGATVARNKLIPVVIAFSINYAAYFAEIFRAGIQSIPRGQYEAAKTLGMTYAQTMKRIILPQMIHRTLPPISNETINLVKDTSLIYILAMNDLLRVARTIVQRDFDMTAFFIAGAFYLVMTAVLTAIFKRMEAHYGKYDE